MIPIGVSLNPFLAEIIFFNLKFPNFVRLFYLELPDIPLEALVVTKYGLRDRHVHDNPSLIGSCRSKNPWLGIHGPKSYRCDDGFFKIVQYRLNPITNQYA